MDRDRILLTPGPLTTTLRTKLAMLKDWGSWDADFNAVTAGLRQRLLDIVHGHDTHALVPLQGTMFAILAFFIASAAYRSFRARSREAAVLLVAAMIVMMGRVPLGEYILPISGDLSGWILNVLNAGVRRAILIGVSLGAVALSLKIIFGVERSYLGGGRE